MIDEVRKLTRLSSRRAAPPRVPSIGTSSFQSQDWNLIPTEYEVPIESKIQRFEGNFKINAEYSSGERLGEEYVWFKEKTLIDIGAEYNHIHNDMIIPSKPRQKLTKPYVYTDYNGTTYAEDEIVDVPTRFGDIQLEVSCMAAKYMNKQIKSILGMDFIGQTDAKITASTITIQWNGQIEILHQV